MPHQHHQRRHVLQDKVFLTATDTTVGFVSQNAKKLTEIKKRPPHKHYIKAVNSLQTLKSFTRVPTAHKKRLRRARRTTFVMPDGHSYRVVKDRRHLLLLERLKWAYTTSANLSGLPYDEAFAKEAADIIVAPLEEHKTPSRIYKLGKNRLKRIR
jgi:tRNA A37 threonylcarbamoyladenosine synthetase subunit TsaC/SUA5/YrdC